MVSTLADSAHFLTRPVTSSGLGSHQTPVATLDPVTDLESGPALIGPILMKIKIFKPGTAVGGLCEDSLV